MATRAIAMRHKTQRPVQFEIPQATRGALQAWIGQAALKPEDVLFPSRLQESPHRGTLQYARILVHWVDEPGLDRADYGANGIAVARHWVALELVWMHGLVCAAWDAGAASATPDRGDATTSAQRRTTAVVSSR